jgi:hypothetical protein
MHPIPFFPTTSYKIIIWSYDSFYQADRDISHSYHLQPMITESTYYMIFASIAEFLSKSGVINELEQVIRKSLFICYFRKQCCFVF